MLVGTEVLLVDVADGVAVVDVVLPFFEVFALTGGAVVVVVVGVEPARGVRAPAAPG